MFETLNEEPCVQMSNSIVQSQLMHNLDVNATFDTVNHNISIVVLYSIKNEAFKKAI